MPDTGAGRVPEVTAAGTKGLGAFGPKGLGQTPPDAAPSTIISATTLAPLGRTAVIPVLGPAPFRHNTVPFGSPWVIEVLHQIQRPFHIQERLVE